MPHKSRPEYDPGPEYVKRKRKACKCINYRCDAHVPKGRSRCHKHAWQRRKRADPIAYIFHHKRNRANERGKTQPWGAEDRGGAWTLTLENFRDWCIYNDYHNKTGRRAGAMSLDRRDSRFGYHVWNLQPMKLGDNSRKHTDKVGYWQADENGVQHYVETEIPF